jgi:hypothetical protein
MLQRIQPPLILVGLLALALHASPSDDVARSGGLVPRAQLIEDARQLMDTIEQTHPDPYVAGGGRIAFHRRFHGVLSSIPAGGLSTGEFLRRLQPFISSIEDSHTGILASPGDSTPLNISLRFRFVEDQLVVEEVAGPELEPLLGASLAAIEGVPLQRILDRQASIRGMENRYGHLALFSLRTLATREALGQVLPEWRKPDLLRVELTLATGQRLTREITLSEAVTESWTTIPTRVDMPSTANNDVAYTFLDDDESTALLVISDLMKYREACELWFAAGLAQAEEMAKAAYEHFNRVPAPADRGTLLAGIPSATETIADLVRRLTAAGTRDLIVDLRGNTGGNSALREILIYLLYGDDALRSLDTGYEIVKLSPLLFAQYEGLTLEEFSENQAYPPRNTDYDFSDEQAFLHRSPAKAQADLTLAKSTSFWKIYETEEFHRPTWKPVNVLVLCSPLTFSSGFNVLTGLVTMGAKVVGTPSAQPGNNFGDVLQFQLKNTGLTVFVSHKQIVAFPDDPEGGRCLKPHYPLTLEKLADLDFDPNAEVLLALEVLGGIS